MYKNFENWSLKIRLFYYFNSNYLYSINNINMNNKKWIIKSKLRKSTRNIFLHNQIEGRGNLKSRSNCNLIENHTEKWLSLG